MELVTGVCGSNRMVAPKCPKLVSFTSSWTFLQRLSSSPRFMAASVTPWQLRLSVSDPSHKPIRYRVQVPRKVELSELPNTEARMTDRYAVVTGANKGIGLEICRKLACEGVMVVLTARDEKRGTEALSSLVKSGLSNVVFHQLDVNDPVSVESMAKFVETRFGRLDILVNNAGVSGVVVDVDCLKALNVDPDSWLSGKATNLVQGAVKQTFEKAEECLNTNYYGCKRVTEALLPLLQLSTSGARIVNVSSLRSELRVSISYNSKQLKHHKILSCCHSNAVHISNFLTETTFLNREFPVNRYGELGDVDSLTEEKLDLILKRFLHDLKQGTLKENGWTIMLPSYSISKATLNAYTRMLAKRHPNMCVNCVHPGFVDTDINWHTGTMTIEEGARGPVMLALLPNGGPSGCYFDQTELSDLAF